MRATIAAAVLCAAACGTHSGPPPGTSPPSETAVHIDPARIDRVRGDLPDGFETADLTGRATPAGLWGLGDDATAEPPQCATLAEPATDVATAGGWSGSGPGGIVYAVVVDAPADSAPDPSLLAECGQWSMSGGRTSGTVTLAAAPAIDGVQTIAMTTAAVTVVEGGTETRSRADTVIAFLNDHIAFIAIVTDPGSPNPQLGQDFAATLMEKTVAALRG